MTGRWTLLALIGAAGCMPAAPGISGQRQRPPGALVMAGCTQEDLPALIVTVRPADLPDGEIRFEIAGAPESIAGREYRLSPLRRDPASSPDILARAELRRNGRFAGWLLGTIRLDRLEPGQGAAGSYRLTGDEGLSLSGRFEAGWSTDAAFCG